MTHRKLVSDPVVGSAFVYEQMRIIAFRLKGQCISFTYDTFLAQRNEEAGDKDAILDIFKEQGIDVYDLFDHDEDSLQRLHKLIYDAKAALLGELSPSSEEE